MSDANNNCLDRDLLALEGSLYLGLDAVAQELIRGSDAVVEGTALTCQGADFQAAGVRAGMVVCVYTTAPEDGRACEITEVDAEALGVSVLRADACDSPIAPPAAEAVSFVVRTYAAQIAAVDAALREKLRRISEAQGIRAADFADSSQLRQAVACGALADICVARAANARQQDANWTKAQHYREQFLARQLQLRLVVDAAGDGTADRTRTLGNVALRRV